jgi:general secretion pathway protein L
VRIGLGALVGVQLVGLNAWAWQQQRTLAAKRQAMEQVLRATHPGVRSVLDAPLQMQRETDRLRALAGRPGEADYEPMLGAAAAAWPDGAGPAPALRFEGARLTLTVAGWGEPQVRQFRDRLRGAGYAAELVEGRVVVAPEKGR